MKYVDWEFEQRLKLQRAKTAESNCLFAKLLELQNSEDPDLRLTDREIRDQLLTLFGAGHEATAAMLTWTWYLLALNPQVEEKLHDEVDRVLGGRTATFADLSELTYTKKVLQESLRLYPPFWGNIRSPYESTEVCGRPLPAGAQVMLAPWLVQRDGRWFPDPLRFDPERFAPEAVRARPKFSYFPFGGGNRRCFGEGLADAEGRLLLATLAQRFAPRLSPEQTVTPDPAITLRPRKGLPMRLMRR